MQDENRRRHERVPLSLPVQYRADSSISQIVASGAVRRAGR